MKKMNQVSVTEFMSKSKEEMYDDAVAMVEKYNRLVDICNDSAERMAELMAKDDINEFKKELQSKVPGEFKIQKLADIVVWADNWIKELKDGLTEEEFTEYIEDGEVRDFETVKKVVLESMERQTVYSNALNRDIADKAAKIELLEKEIEGRKEGYYALKELMDTKYISIDEHNKIVDQFKEEIKKLNKCIMNKNESINTGNEAIINLRKEIGAREDEAKKLENRIKELKESFNALKEETATRYITIETHNSICETYENRIAELENDMRYKTIIEYQDIIASLNKEIDYYKNQERIRTDQLRATESKVEELYKRIERLKKDSKNKNDIIRKAYTRYIDEACKDREEIMDECYKNLTKDDTGYIGFKQYTLRALEKKEGNEKEAKEYICDSADVVFYEKKAEEKRKEEETEVKGNDRTSSGRYPWGAKVNDIPCGEDSIE